MRTQQIKTAGSIVDLVVDVKIGLTIIAIRSAMGAVGDLIHAA